MSEDKSLESMSRKDNIYVIPVSWQVFSTVHVEADNLKDAMSRLEEKLADVPLGSGEYIDESYRIGSEDEAAALFTADGSLPFRGVFINRQGEILRSLPGRKD